MSMCAILSGGVKRHRNIAKRSFLFLDLDCMNKIRAHKKTNPSEAVIYVLILNEVEILNSHLIGSFYLPKKRSSTLTALFQKSPQLLFCWKKYKTSFFDQTVLIASLEL